MMGAMGNMGTPLRAAIYLRIGLDREDTRLGVDRHTAL